MSLLLSTCCSQRCSGRVARLSCSAARWWSSGSCRSSTLPERRPDLPHEQLEAPLLAQAVGPKEERHVQAGRFSPQCVELWKNFGRGAGDADGVEQCIAHET